MTFAIALLVVAVDAPQPNAAPLPATRQVSLVAVQAQQGMNPPLSRPGGPPEPSPAAEPPLPAPSLPAPVGEDRLSPPSSTPPPGVDSQHQPMAPPSAPSAGIASSACPSAVCPSQPSPTFACPSGGLAPGAGATCPPAIPSCQPCMPACQTQLVERKILVPTTVMENQTVKVTKFRPETRAQTVTVYRQVPETREVPQQYTVLVPEQRTRTVTRIVQREVVRNVEQPYAVMVPYQEQRQAFRTVTRMVPIPETRVVYRAGGRWETRVLGVPYMTAYGGCTPCPPQPCTTRVWVPEVIRQPVTVTTMKPVVEREPYNHTVTLFRPETRSRMIQVRECVPEQVSHQETFTVQVPQTQTRMVQVTEYRTVPEQQQQQCTVMVPYEEDVQVQVPVCRMVEQTVTTPVQTCSTVAPCPLPPCPTQPAPALALGPPPGLAPAAPLPWSVGMWPAGYAGGGAELPIFRDLATGRTYRYPPPTIPPDRLIRLPYERAGLDLAIDNLWR